MIKALKKIFSPVIMERALAQFGSVSIEQFALYSLIGVVAVVLIVLLRKWKGKTTELSDILSGMVLAVYVSIVLQLTLVCRESGSRIGIELDIFHGLVGPDTERHWLMIAYAVLNCLLFVPLGVVLSLFSFVHERGLIIQFLLVLLISFAASMVIECVQLITQRGYYEVQDLMLNTLGGIIGWGLFRILFLFGTILKHRKVEE